MKAPEIRYLCAHCHDAHEPADLAWYPIYPDETSDGEWLCYVCGSECDVSAEIALYEAQTEQLVE